MTRWAIYARFSSEMQNPKSIDDQVRECQAAIAKQGGVVVEVYSDAAVSGAHTAKRPGYQAMFAGVKARAFDRVMAEDCDRFARQLEEIARLYAVAEHHDVELWTLSDGRVTQLHTGLRGLMGEMYLKNLADKTRRDLMGVVARGGIPGGRCYGYDVATTAKRTINEAEADIVRRIYREYAEGRSPRAICRDLNADGIPAPRGSCWRISTLIGNPARLNGTLNNPIYVGRPAFNRQRFLKNPETGKREARPNPPEQWIFEEHPGLRIVSDDLAAAVVAQRTKNGNGPLAKTRHPKTLLSGLVRCEECGAPMSKAGLYFRCIAQMNSGTCRNGRGVRVDRLENMVLDAIEAAITNEGVIARMAARFHQELAWLEEMDRMNAETAARASAETERKIANIVRAIEEGTATPALKARLAELEAQRRPPIRPASAKVTRLVPDARQISRASIATCGRSSPVKTRRATPRGIA